MKCKDSARVFWTATSCFGMLISGCAIVPPVYVIDRQTLMEQEASGDWPDFEESLLKDLRKPSVSMLGSEGKQEGERKLYNVLNQDLAHQQDAKKAKRAPAGQQGGGE